MPSPRVIVLTVTLAVTAVLVVLPGHAEARTFTCRGHEATIVGTPGDDTLYGTDGDDVIVSRGGDDIVFSGGGDDVVCAGVGDDIVFAGEGDDLVAAGGGDDFVYGGPGADVLRGGAGDDVLEGGPGRTRAAGNAGNDELWGTWCTPPGSMPHFCRWPDLATPSGEYAELLEGTRLLRRGSVGEDVGQLQTLLGVLGYDAGSADGVFGARTVAAVRAFQADSGLDVDGVVGSSTRAALAEAAPESGSPSLPADWVLGKAGTLRSGSRGEAVAVLQRTLDGLGYDPGPADGVFGSRTTAAVQAFQAGSGLDADGVAGGATKRALFGDLGDRKVLRGGEHFDTCNSATRKRECENRRGLRPGAPGDATAADEWRPLITEIFTEWGLEDEIDRAVAVAACESLADPMITTPTGSGHYWIGLFQHTDRYWEARARRAGIDGASPYDPTANTTVAALLVQESIEGGHPHGPWGHFGCGKWLGFWPDE